MPSSLMRWIGSFGSGAGVVGCCCCASSVTGEMNKIRSSTRAVERRRIMMDLLERSRLAVIIIVRKKVSHKGTKGRHKGGKKKKALPLCLPFVPLCEIFLPGSRARRPGCGWLHDRFGSFV